MGLVDNFAASIVKGASIPPEETGMPLNPGELYDRAVTSLTSAANDFNRTVLQPAQQQFTQHVNSFVSDPINYVKVTSAGFDPTKTTEVDPGSMLRGMRGTSATINNQQVFISDSGKVLIKIPGVDGGKNDWVDSTNITQTVGGKLSGTEVKVLDGIRGVEFSGANGEKYFRWPDGKTAKLDPNSGTYVGT